MGAVSGVSETFGLPSRPTAPGMERNGSLGLGPRALLAAGRGLREEEPAWCGPGWWTRVCCTQLVTLPSLWLPPKPTSSSQWISRGGWASKSLTASRTTPGAPTGPTWRGLARIRFLSCLYVLGTHSARIYSDFSLTCYNLPWMRAERAPWTLWGEGSFSSLPLGYSRNPADFGDVA